MKSKNEDFPFELTLAEFAVLELTNDGIIERPKRLPIKPKEPIILTSKYSYLWGSTIALILEKNPEFQVADFIDAIQYAIKKNRERVKEYYSKYMAHIGYHPFDEGAHFINLHYDFLGYLKFGHDFIRQAQLSAKSSYQKLTEKGLIEDPIFTTIFGISVALIGFIPYGFTQKTRDGRTVYRKIKALFWTYETQEKNGEKITNIQFRLWKILRGFKRVLAEEMDEVVKESKGEKKE